MTAEEAMAFLREHGVVLASAKGPVPRLADLIAGESIKGSWWAHAKSHDIFNIFQEVGESPDILVCRLVNGKVTFVHRRLWPALVRVAHRFQANQLAQVHQEHTPSGHHVSRELSYPKWVPPEVTEEAQRLSEQEAWSALGPLATLPDKALKPTGRKKRPAAA
jgi:hypothetical protein